MLTNKKVIIWTILVIITFIMSFVIGVLISAYFQLKVPPDDSELLIASWALGRCP